MSGYLPATVSYCTSCGTELQIDARYCSNCGKAITMALPPAPIYMSSPLPRPMPAPLPTTMVVPESDGGIGKLFSKSGRVGRLEFFLTTLASYGGATLGSVLLLALSEDVLGVLLIFALWILAAIVYFCAGIKRLHDFDQSGWLMLLSILVIPGLVLLLLMLFKGPSQRLNRYGYAGSGSPF